MLLEVVVPDPCEYTVAIFKCAMMNAGAVVQTIIGKYNTPENTTVVK
jgi:hypothetical protein